MTYNPTWPLNEPIETEYGTKATVIMEDDDGMLIGFAERISGGKRGVLWNRQGRTIDGSVYHLIPPKPARQYGYVVWHENENPRNPKLMREERFDPRDIRPQEFTRFPIPRPGETLCVRPSFDDVLDALERAGALGRKAEAKSVMALLDGEA